MKKLYRGRVEKGKVVLYNQREYDMLVYSLNEKEIEITLAKIVKKRSLSQNNYFHGVILPLASEYTGYSVIEMKEVLRMLFLSYTIQINGEIFKVGRSTASLSTVEFEEFNSQCRHWGDEQGIYIPEPNEVTP